MAEPADAPGGESVEALWSGFVGGSAADRDRLLARYYDEFRGVARRVLRDDAAQLALQPTDLAHEAALRILKLDRIDWQGRTHFLALSARVMRQVLLDEVRRFRAAKRQAPPVTTQWYDEPSVTTTSLDVEALDAALTRLEAIDPGRARVVELRFFVGLSLEEIAAEQGISESTVKRQWRSARAWLLKELGSPGPAG